MKFLLLALFTLSGQAMASNCLKAAITNHGRVHPRLGIVEVRYKGALLPGEDKPYMQGEIWNDKKIPLDIYEIKSVFMASFIHVALVDKKTCETKKLIEVFFE